MTIASLEKNIGLLLEKAAVRYGEKPLIHFHEQGLSFSYSQFNTEVNKYASALQSAGIKQGDHLAIMMSNCPEFFLTWLALARLGVIAIPLNTRYHEEDLVYILNDSDASGLVMETGIAPVYRKAGSRTPNIKKVFTIGEEVEDMGPCLSYLTHAASSDFSAPDVSSDHMMSIQYTSGTTGFPKGCMLTHEYWLTLGFVAATNMKQHDVFLCVEPFYYMDPPWELIMCIIKGMTMVATKKYSPSRYMELVRQYGTTVSWVLMPHWIYKQPESPLDKEHSLRLLFAGAIPRHIHKPFEERFNVALREGYGMTEIGPGIVMPLEAGHMTGSGSVGKPTAYRYVKIVDDDGREVPRGKIGELWVTGPGLFKGYYNNPAATAEVFEGEWFKTGDLFRQDEHGYYYIVGRKKDMIKRSGDNISAVEVENVLMSHPKILAAAVIPVPDPDRKEEIKACIVPAQGEHPETIPPEEIIDYCLERIAEFKVPRYIEYREKDFERTPTGKIMKNNLLAGKEDPIRGCYDRLAEQ